MHIENIEVLPLSLPGDSIYMHTLLHRSAWHDKATSETIANQNA